MPPYDTARSSFSKCVEVLTKSLTKDQSDPTVLAGIIKHFELAYETSWKAVKSYLAEELGIQTMSPRGAYTAAFQNQLIDDENAWLAMMQDRNFSVHVYSESDAKLLVGRIQKTHIILLKALVQKLPKKGVA